jgi:phosphatidylinositol alpha-mannosyltransferase
MRVGLVCPYSFDSPGGVQNHVLGLAAYLRDQGHEPHILAPGDHVPEELAPETAAPPTAAPANAAHDTAAPLTARQPAGTGGEGSFTSAGTATAVRYNGSVAKVNFGPLTAARVARWLRRGQFDLVHLHEPITPSVSILALWAADVPVVATFHTATPHSRSMRLAGGAMRAAVEKIDAGIAVSESARKVVVQHLGRDAVVVPNGFRYADFAGAARRHPRTWRGGAAPRLSFLGRLDEPRKGLDTLLAAVPGLRRRWPDLDIVVAGVGRRRLPEGCRALGLISDREKVQLLATSDVFVAPHVARESFGIVLLEAMAAGAAVVASDLPAFADLLTEPGETQPTHGRTFPAGDSEALTAAVHQVLLRPDRDRAAAAQLASSRYDWSVVGAAITDVYEATVELATPTVRDRAVAQ